MIANKRQKQACTVNFGGVFFSPLLSFSAFFSSILLLLLQLRIRTLFLSTGNPDGSFSMAGSISFTYWMLHLWPGYGDRVPTTEGLL